MIGSHTAMTFSMRSQAALAPPDSMVRPASNAVILRDFIKYLRLPLRLRLRFGPDRSSSTGPVDEQLLDDEEQEVGAVAHRAGDQDRAVHVGELIRDLRIDDAVTQAIDRAD